MVDAVSKLQTLQKAIGQMNDPKKADEAIERLYFSEIDGLLQVSFYGLTWKEPFAELIDLLSTKDVAARIRSLEFQGPDEGANGTRNWDFTALVESEVDFPNLTSLFVEPTAPEHHNQTIIAQAYDEEGMIARLIAKMPQIESLTVPSAPNISFFDVGQRPLHLLRVDSGYAHQNFIANLGTSSSFPELRFLDFGDYNQRYMEDYQQQCTPFDDYVRLFESTAFASVGFFILRNSILSAGELSSLKKLRKDLQFKIIEAHGNFVE